MSDKILELFKQGKKMIDISRELNIPYNTVKSVVRRNEENKIKVSLKSSILGKCLCCGKDIAIIEGKKKRVFCSSNCRVKYWRLSNGKRRIS